MLFSATRYLTNVYLIKVSIIDLILYFSELTSKFNYLINYHIISIIT